MVYLIFAVSPRFTTPLGEETMNAAHGEYIPSEQGF